MTPASIMKIGAFLSVVILVGTGASIASAQTIATPYAVCTNLSTDLVFGSRHSSVTDLQRFLVSQNYPGGGNWMITGYFGRATEAAVKNFQTTRGLPQTGVVDAATRSAIANYTCGGTGGIIITPVHSAPAIPVYGVTTRSSGVNIHSLNPSSGGVGAVVTVYGDGFTPRDNTVRFGNGIITGLISADGRSVSFAIPSELSGFGKQYVTNGIYNISVKNGNGQLSNTLAFTVGSDGNCCTSFNSDNYVPMFRGIHGPTRVQRGTQNSWTAIVNNEYSDYFITEVNWGDGSAFDSQRINSRNSHSQTFTHTYSTQGTYNILFSVATPSGKKNYSTVTVVVE